MGTRGRASVVPMVSPTRPPGYPKYPRLHRLSERHHRVGPYRRRCGRNPVTANVSRGLAVWQWRPESGKSQLQGPRRTLAQDSGCERVCRPDPPAPTTDWMTARYGPQRAASCRRARSQSRSERGGEAHPFASRVGWQLRGRCVVWRRRRLGESVVVGISDLNIRGRLRTTRRANVGSADCERVLG